MEIRFKLFFAQFLSISSVDTEQSQVCVKNTVAVKQEQGESVVTEQYNFFRVSKIIDNDTHTFD